MGLGIGYETRKTLMGRKVLRKRRVMGEKNQEREKEAVHGGESG